MRRSQTVDERLKATAGDRRKRSNMKIHSCVQPREYGLASTHKRVGVGMRSQRQRGGGAASVSMRRKKVEVGALSRVGLAWLPRK